MLVQTLGSYFKTFEVNILAPPQFPSQKKMCFLTQLASLHPFHTLTLKKSKQEEDTILLSFFLICHPKENHVRVQSKCHYQVLVYNCTYGLLNRLVNLGKPVWIQSRIVLIFLVPWHPILQKEVQHGKIVLSPCFLIKASTITCLVPVSNYFRNPSFLRKPIFFAPVSNSCRKQLLCI